MINKEKSFASAVIYVHNAENRIEGFLKTIINVMEENFENSEIICVNDSSTDDSLKKIKQTGSLAAGTTVSVVNMSYFHGLELAMNAGSDLAIGDYVFEFDYAFLDYEPSLIMDVYRKALEGFDIVSASANKKERFSSRMFYWLFNKYSMSKYKMTTESFRILSRRALNRTDSMNKTIPYRKAVYSDSGLKTFNLRYDNKTCPERKTDKLERAYRTKLAADSLLLFTQIGYSFAKFMTFLMMFISFFMIVYSLLVFFSASPVEGWTTTILFLSVAFLGMFGILTVIIKYLQLIVELVFKRKKYSFESVEKITGQVDA
ncbi:MAG: glycosyltransferase [Clostridiales bacterium]|nr:glycosyltransferase [Clostridiales bacterium]